MSEDKINIIDLKLVKSTYTAMNQIDLKRNIERFALCGLSVVKVVINFSRERHVLEDWVVE